MNSKNGDSGNVPTEPLNYFNYFTEVEEEFVRRRGKPLLVSPMDWALIESWKNTGIPLHIVLRAINSAFDAYDARPRRFRKVNSIFYCQQEVEAAFAEYRLAQVGSPPPAKEGPGEKQGKKKSVKEPATIFPKPVLLDFFARSDDELARAEQAAAESERAAIEDAVRRARSRLAVIVREIETAERADAESIERDLDGIDRLILESITAWTGAEGVQKIRSEAESQLRPYRRKMDEKVYEQTIRNFISRRLRETHQIPRLSLFYI
ncbi:MAG TPA: hypothetical protein VFQ92_24265 [Blastocatellia bacterium]|nr:hypothetical protein [Blastocatellia bacterium]